MVENKVRVIQASVESMSFQQSYPRDVTLGGETFTLRLMAAGDDEAVLAFAKSLPVHDLLFLPRDITHPRVVKAWIAEMDRGGMISLVAVRKGRIVGTAALVRDAFFWSKHVAELRIVVAPEARKTGLGRQLLQELFAIALAENIEKITAQMTTDQVGAIAMFESIGFKAEGLLRDAVKDANGKPHDIVIMGNIIAQTFARLEALGILGAAAAE